MAKPGGDDAALREEELSLARTRAVESEHRAVREREPTTGDVAVTSLTPELLDAHHREQYELRDVLSAGGMGAVYRARDIKLRRSVAIKVMHERIALRPDLVRRFIMEAQVTAQLEHPGIVPTYTIASGDNGQPQLAMRLIPGQSMQSLIESEADRCGQGRERLRGLGDRLELFARACDAVHFAHERGVVHRDLKPENIMIGRHRDAYVMDWGLCKVRAGELDGALPTEVEIDVDQSPQATLHGQMMGTLGYMPPEQAKGQLELIGPAVLAFCTGEAVSEIGWESTTSVLAVPAPASP